MLCGLGLQAVDESVCTVVPTVRRLCHLLLTQFPFPSPFYSAITFTREAESTVILPRSTGTVLW